MLNVLFIPTDLIGYNRTSATVSINVMKTCNSDYKAGECRVIVIQ